MVDRQNRDEIEAEPSAFYMKAAFMARSRLIYGALKGDLYHAQGRWYRTQADRFAEGVYSVRHNKGSRCPKVGGWMNALNIIL